jgi:hypothetical protein
MYSDVKSVISKLEEEDIKGEEEMLESIFDTPESALYPGTRIYEVVAGREWGKSWKFILSPYVN